MAIKLQPFIAGNSILCATAVGYEHNLLSMYDSLIDSSSPIAGFPAEIPFPTVSACEELLLLAIEQRKWKHAATLAVALHSVCPQEAWYGLEEAFDIARQEQPVSEEMQSLQ